MRGGAPWVFSNEIVMDAQTKELPPGELVELTSGDGTMLGAGYCNPKSLITVRLLAPPNTEIDARFFRKKFGRALQLRERFYTSPFYRLVHAEGDGLPGLIVDRFGDACVVQIATAGMERLCDCILDALETAIAPAIVILRNDVSARALEGLESYVRTVKGEVAKRIVVEENGLTYFADPQAGQKSGWYYDQRENRLFMANLRAARVLDAYCYSGGFAVLAAAKGAGTVLGLDSSEPALALAAEAAAANGVASVCRFVRCDVLDELRRLANERERFEMVICDPPPFAPSRTTRSAREARPR